MNIEEFTKIMTGVSKLYNKPMDKEEITLWLAFFKDNTTHEFKEAINNYIKTKTKFPTVADIKNEIAKQKTKDLPKAEDEWELVLKTVRKFGSYRIHEAMNELKPHTAYIVSHIGYINICMAEDQTWNKKEFIEEYNQIKDKEIEKLQIGDNGTQFLNTLKMLQQGKPEWFGDNIKPNIVTKEEQQEINNLLKGFE